MVELRGIFYSASPQTCTDGRMHHTQPVAPQGAAIPGDISLLRRQLTIHSCSGGAELYEAAVLLKEVLRGRGILLIEDRTDIVGAAEADGVVLSRQGECPHRLHKDA